MDYLFDLYSQLQWPAFMSAAVTSALLIFAAEIGDKSQLVCMTLAARHKPAPVMIGAVLAFVLLNTLAVIFGGAIASWIPQAYLSAAVAVLFVLFGIHLLRLTDEDEEDTSGLVRSHHSIIISTFLLITAAEFGDKTQLAVVALSTTHIPVAVWLGATLALVTTSALGVWAGRTLLPRIPVSLFHRISGVLFIGLAIFAATQAYRAL